MFRELLIHELPVNLLVAALALGFFRLCGSVWRQLFKGSWGILGLLALYMSILYALTGIPSIRYFVFRPQVNLIPFSDFGDSRFFWLSGMNTLLTVPLGMLLPLCWKQYQHFPRTAAVGFLVSLSIELSQMFCFRATDIDDLILNTLGTMVGFLLGKLLFGRLLWGKTKQGKWGFWVLNGILIFLCFFLRQELYDLEAMLL